MLTADKKYCGSHQEKKLVIYFSFNKVLVVGKELSHSFLHHHKYDSLSFLRKELHICIQKKVIQISRPEVTGGGLSWKTITNSFVARFQYILYLLQ